MVPVHFGFKKKIKMSDKKILKIAIIGSKGIPARYGGIQQVVERVAEGLADLGCEVTVYSRFHYSEIKKTKFSYKNFLVINVKGFKTKHLDAISHSFIATINAISKDYDIIAYVATAGAFFSLIPKIWGKKVVFHSHGLEILGFKWNSFEKFFMKLLIKFTSWPLDAVTTVSYSQLNNVQKLYHKKTLLVSNGIDIKNDFTKLNDFEKYFLFVGRLVQEKGLHCLIQAFKQLSEYQDYKLKIVGLNVHTNSYNNYLTSLASENSNIEFVGPKYNNDLDCLYKNAYCVIIPSLIDSFSLVLLEALYKNGVVICSNIEQFQYLAQNYVKYFKVGDVNDLSDKMTELILNNDKRNELLLKSRKFPFKNFSWDRISVKYYNFYKNVVKY